MLRSKLVLMLITAALIVSAFPGCNGSDKDTAIDFRIEDKLGIDFSRPEYVENQNRPLPKISQDIETWTPTAKEVAGLSDQGDVEGALRLLYQDILQTNPLKEDQFFFSVFSYPWFNLFCDPELVFRQYRDNDRTSLSEDEKAACDMMVALTYDMGRFRGSTEETFYPEGTEGQRIRYVEYVEQREALALETYGKIADRYPDNNVGVLAKLVMARSCLSDENELLLLTMVEEIAREHPGSIYQTQICVTLEALYGNKAQENYLKSEEEYYVKKALSVAESILRLPDIQYASSSTDHASAHDCAEKDIRKFRSRIERKGWSAPE